MTRDEAAKLFNVSKRGIADAAFILQNGSPELIEDVKQGRVNLQEALRQLGKTTQRDRNRQKQQQVIDLCDAVLCDEIETAKVLAATIILAIDAAMKKSKTTA
jgi:hypothetical protein